MNSDAPASTGGRILVIGESLVDVVATGSLRKELPGGSPMNVSIGAARLGLDVAFLTRLGADDRGTMIASRLRNDGVTLVLPPDDAPTSVAEATIDETGAASYAFDIEWSLPALPSLPAVDAVHFGSIAAAMEPGADATIAIVRELAPVATVTFDPNIRPMLEGPVADARARVESHVALSDVVKASDEDLEWLYPGRDPRSIAEQWIASGATLVAVTLGAHGSFALTADVYVHQPGIPVDVVDTIGAGDSFMSGLLAGLSDAGALGDRNRLASLTDADVATVLSLAARAAALTVARAGSEPPTRGELTS